MYFAYIALKPEQRPEDLFQCLMAFIDDNLLSASSGITHHGEAPISDEELSPSLENFIFLTWLRLLHPSLPRLVKQRYGTELWRRTLASVKPEISQAVESLLDELHASDESSHRCQHASKLERNFVRENTLLTESRCTTNNDAEPVCN